MNWYLAKIVFRIVCGNGDHTAQFDEQLRLISAADKKEAFNKAQTAGKKGEDTFFNKNEQLVQWQFINVSELYQLSGLIDGAELYSRIEERENADQYIEVVNQKAENIIFSSSHRLLELA